MSKEVDEKVVEMRFDNSQFEKNVQTSMSTLDKLKAKLNLSGASKGLEDVCTAAKKVDMSGLNSGVETLRLNFSALDVMATTALANISNSVVNTAKKVVSAITINPVKDGFAEYETQMNAIQTILANTQKEGTTVEIVNKALYELNRYADKTIYNFTEMTRNIGTFTAAGVKLDTSVSAIQGIANLAAISGSSSQQASTAMYQLSQAIASGTVKLMDWNSVVNAGMGGQVFQEALIRTSEHLQTGAKSYIDAAGSFRESLSKGWLTTEVLTETLDQFSTAAETEEEFSAAVQKFVDQGYSEEQAQQIANMAKTAGEAATKVKTFSQLIDTTKEALGSGWTESWRIIIGDFEEARQLWSSVSIVLSDFINNMSEARNAILNSAFGRGFSNLIDRINSAISPIENVVDVVQDTITVLGDLDEVADKVIYGTFGNGQIRYEQLTEAGVNYYRVQNRVNEKLGDEYRHSDELIKAQDELLGIQNGVVEATNTEGNAVSNLTDEKKALIKEIAALSDEEKRAKGYTEDQIDAFKELGDTANKLGIPINDFIDNMDQITGRWLFINSFKNIGEGIIKSFKAIGGAWRETFDPISADTVFNLIAGFHKFTTKLNITDETADKLKRTFKGLFAILDIIKTVTGGGLRISFKVLSKILGAFDLDILDVTATIGDLLVAFRDFLFDNDLINKGFEVLGNGAKFVADKFEDLYSAIKNMPKVQEFINNIKDTDWKEVSGYVIDGLKNGLKDGIISIPEKIGEIAKAIIDKFKEVLDIHSPSKETYKIGEFTIQGFVNGLKDGSSNIWETIKGIGTKTIDKFKNFDFSKVFAVAVSAGLFLLGKNITEGFKNLTSLLAGVGDVLSGASKVLDASAKPIKKILNNTAKVVKSFSKALNAKAFETKASAIKDLAISVAILAGAVFILAQIDSEKLWSTVGALAVLAALLVALAVAMDKLSSATIDLDAKNKTFKVDGLKSNFIALGIVLLLMAKTVKIIGTMDTDQYTQGMFGLITLIGGIVLVFAAFGTLVKGKSAQNMDKAGKMLRKMATTLLLMVVVVKLVGMLKWTEMAKGAAFVIAFLGFVTLLMLVTTISGKGINALGNTMLKISASMILMLAVVKLTGLLKVSDAIKGGLFAVAFLAFMVALLKISNIDHGDNLDKMGKIMRSISTAMLLMSVAVKIIGLLSVEDMIKGGLFAVAFLAFIAALVKVTKIGSEEKIAKVSGMLIASAVAIALMAATCVILGIINTSDLIKGGIAVAAFGAMIVLLLKYTKDAKDVKGTLIGISIAIGIMAASILVLSLVQPKKLVAPVAAISVLILMFKQIVKSSKDITKATGTMIAMGVVIALMTAALVILARLEINKVLVSAASLSLLMLSLSATMFVVSKIPITAATKGALGLAAFVAIIAALLVVLGGLSKIDGVSDLVSSGGKLLSDIGYAIGNFVGSIIGGFSSGVSSGLPDIGKNLSEFIENATPFINTVKDVDAGKLLENVGSLTAAILLLTAADFVSGIASFLPYSKSFSEMGKDLSGFMINATPFITGMSTISSNTVNTAKSLAETLLLFTASELIDGITKWVTGGKSLSDFGSQLISFGAGLVGFSNILKEGNIDEGAIQAAANAGKIMTSMQENLTPMGGVVQWFEGEKDLANFGQQLLVYGSAIVEFSKKVSQGIDEDAVQASANAGKIMTSMQENLEPTGGVVQWLMGERDMSIFGQQLLVYGSAIVEFSKKVSQGIDQDAVQAAANAGKIMTSMQSSINSSDGVLQWLIGNKDLNGFSLNLGTYASAIVNLSQKVKGHIDEKAVKDAANAGKIMASLAKDIPADGGALQWLMGDRDLSRFGYQLYQFGGGIASFSQMIADHLNTTAVDTAVKATDSIIKLTKNVMTLDTTKVASLNVVDDMGSMLKSYAQKVATINKTKIDESLVIAKKLYDFIVGLGDVSDNNVTAFTDAINELTSININNDKTKSDFSNIGSSYLKAFSNGFNDDSSEVNKVFENTIDSIKNVMSKKAPSFANVSELFSDNLSDGFEDSSGSVSETAVSLVSSVVDAIKGYQSNYYDAGFNLVSGFAAGIANNSGNAITNALNMAQSAYDSVREALKIHSPSRVFMKLASYIPQGFAIGISQMNGRVKESASDMASVAVNSTRSAMARLAGIINGDIEYIQPTVRPVLDLSDVRSGAETINGLFGDGLIGVRMNASAINTSFNENRQNGFNTDVLSAINRLDKSINSLERPSYVVNGITYDDGSGLTEAIETLVRAAKIERRL